MKDHVNRQLYVRTAAQPNFARYDVEALTEVPGIKNVPLATIQGDVLTGWLGFTGREMCSTVEPTPRWRLADQRD